MSAPAWPRRGRPTVPGLLVAVAVLAGLAALGAVAARGGQPAVTRAQQVHQIASGLRCPVCRDLSAADSPAPLAQQMRQQIAQQLAAGESPHRIRQRFLAAYGDSVLMTPPHHGLGQVAYVLPLLVLGVGVLAATLLLRRWLSRPAPEPAVDSPPRLSASERRRVEMALSRLREEESG